MRDPGRFGKWTDLHHAKPGDIGTDWPYSAQGHQVIENVDEAWVCDTLWFGLGMCFDRISNKNWVCIRPNLFIYQHDNDYRLIRIEEVA